MTRPQRASGPWLVGGGVLVFLTMSLLAVGARGPGAVIVPILIAVAASAVTTWSVLRSRAQRRDYEARLTAWAAEQATHHERLRIARELHDIVSHGLGLIIVRATAARRVPSERDQALADIEHAGRAAVGELRRMLTVLRDEDAPLRPVWSLADIPAIAGPDAVVRMEDLGDVSPGVQVTACAVVREAVANTLRHAGPTGVRVVLERDGATIVVTVSDDGPQGSWTPTPGAGHGLLGLRERVAALGGTLSAAPAGTGFELIARLPDGEPR